MDASFDDHEWTALAMTISALADSLPAEHRAHFERTLSALIEKSPRCRSELRHVQDWMRLIDRINAQTLNA